MGIELEEEEERNSFSPCGHRVLRSLHPLFLYEQTTKLSILVPPYFPPPPSLSISFFIFVRVYIYIYVPGENRFVAH